MSKLPGSDQVKKNTDPKAAGEAGNDADGKVNNSKPDNSKKSSPDKSPKVEAKKLPTLNVPPEVNSAKKMVLNENCNLTVPGLGMLGPGEEITVEMLSNSMNNITEESAINTLNKHIEANRIIWVPVDPEPKETKESAGGEDVKTAVQEPSTGESEPG